MTGDRLTFDQPFNTDPCLEFVSVGNGSQGAALRNIFSSINTFYMEGPNLVDAGNIDVTARATGEYARILRYLQLLPREMCCTGGYMHE